MHDLFLAAASGGASSFSIILGVLGGIGTVVSIVMALLAYTRAGQRAEKTDLVDLERRLVTLEQAVRSNSAGSVLDRITALEQKVNLLHNYDASTLQERIAKIETKIDVFWSGISTDFARLLHSPQEK